MASDLKRAALTYDDLAERLKKHGFKETKASIANKLARESLPAAFFLEAKFREEVVGTPMESNLATAFNIIYSAVWKSTVSDEWRHTVAGMIVVPSGRDETFDILDGEFPAEKLRYYFIPGDSQLSG